MIFLIFFRCDLELVDYCSFTRW